MGLESRNGDEESLPQLSVRRSARMTAKAVAAQKSIEVKAQTKPHTTQQRKRKAADGKPSSDRLEYLLTNTRSKLAMIEMAVCRNNPQMAMYLTWILVTELLGYSELRELPCTFRNITAETLRSTTSDFVSGLSAKHICNSSRLCFLGRLIRWRYHNARLYPRNLRPVHI